MQKLKTIFKHTRRTVAPQIELYAQAWRSRYRFSALLLTLILPLTPLAKPRHEQQPNTDLYVMF